MNIKLFLYFLGTIFFVSIDVFSMQPLEWGPADDMSLWQNNGNGGVISETQQNDSYFIYEHEDIFSLFNRICSRTEGRYNNLPEFECFAAPYEPEKVLTIHCKEDIPENLQNFETLELKLVKRYRQKTLFFIIDQLKSLRDRSVPIKIENLLIELEGVASSRLKAFAELIHLIPRIQHLTLKGDKKMNSLLKELIEKGFPSGFLKRVKVDVPMNLKMKEEFSNIFFPCEVIIEGKNDMDHNNRRPLKKLKNSPKRHLQQPKENESSPPAIDKEIENTFCKKAKITYLIDNNDTSNT